MQTIQSLHADLRALVASEREALVLFLHKLDAFDHADGHLALGKPTLWAYLTESLGLRESTAARRLAALKLLRRFPQIADPIADGRLCVTTLGLLAPLMTPGNADEIIARASNLSKRETERLAAALQPRTPPREGLRLLPARPPPPPAPVADADPGERQTAAVPAPAPAPAPVLPPPRRGPAVLIEPCSADLSSMRVTVDRAFEARLERARSLASHEFPTGDVRAILFAALGDFIEKRERRKGLAKPRRPRPPAPPPPAVPGTRAPISAETVRAVFERDDGCCQFTGLDGQKCGSTWQLELHHRRPAKQTGSSQPDDLEIRCKPHNHYEAKVDFGAEFIERLVAQKRARARERAEQAALPLPPVEATSG